MVTTERNTKAAKANAIIVTSLLESECLCEPSEDLWCVLWLGDLCDLAVGGGRDWLRATLTGGGKNAGSVWDCGGDRLLGDGGGGGEVPPFPFFGGDGGGGERGGGEEGGGEEDLGGGGGGDEGGGEEDFFGGGGEGGGGGADFGGADRDEFGAGAVSGAGAMCLMNFFNSSKLDQKELDP